MKIFAADRPDVPPLEMPERFRTEIVYFAAASDAAPPPPLAPGEYYIPQASAAEFLDTLVIEIISPLAAAAAEVDVSEDQERWLRWMLDHRVERVRCG
ncbi:MAG TPA: hypothetical protein VGN57_18015 [Pirellulaceae bacterium]|jgi:hypothetical protein|nr:hypothetical protein [Pirellulaceae bacterium]